MDIDEGNLDGDGASQGSSGGIKLMGLNDTKAGMSGLDVKSINRTIQEASKGSKFYIHKKAVQEKLDKKVKDLKVQVRSYTPAQLQSAENEMKQRADVLEAKRDLSRVIVHLDMDAFFAAVEMRDNPALKDVPMAVGGSAMLCTSNYVARRYGVRAAMPGFIAKKLCPQLVIVPVNYDKYKKASEEVYEVLSQYDPDTYMSLDEAQFDLTDYLLQRNLEKPENEMANPQELVQEIRAKIFERTNLTASAGIAPNGFLAKICSDINKPNNQYFLEPTLESVKSFIEALPIRKVNGIGAVTEQMLNGLKVQTCGDIWKYRGIINLAFKPATVSFLLRVTLGIGETFISRLDSSETADDRKSISCERTFSSTSDIQEFKRMCKSLCENVHEDLLEKDMLCRSVCVKIKTTAFDVRTKVKSLGSHTDDCDIIFQVAWKTFESLRKEFDNGELSLRLLGVRLSNLVNTQRQTESGPIAKRSKQTRIDSVLHKLSPDCRCSKCSSRFKEPEPVPGRTDQNVSSIVTSEFNQPVQLDSASNIILHVFPMPGNGADDMGCTAQCPICLSSMSPSVDTDEYLQHVLAASHLEWCAVTAFEDCGILFEKRPSFRIREHKHPFQNQDMDVNNESFSSSDESL